MSTYVEAYKGYIADVPELWFRRCDGNVYHFDELTQAQVQPNTDQIEINTGWSLYPSAYLPGQSSMTMDITSAQFDADLFAMTNNTEFADGEIGGDVEIFWDSRTNPRTNPVSDYYSRKWPTNETPLFHLDELEMSFSSIGGSHDWTLVQMGQPVTAKDNGYIVTVTPAYIEGSTENELKATVHWEDDPDWQGIKPSITTIRVYFRALIYEKAQVAKFDNKSVAVGEAVLKWPVYASGDDCTESSIKGFLVLRMFRARITTMPGFDQSYKSASTFAFQLSTIDPKRDDGMVYDMAYFDSDAE